VNDRTEFNKKGEEILDFVNTFGTMSGICLDKLYPQDIKVINYLIKNRRLYKSPDGSYIGTNQDPQPDKHMIAALGVLTDIFDKVQSYAKATAPAQISFVTHTGDYYEIIYVGYGMEAMVSASSQLAMKKSSLNCADSVKRIVIIEDKSQMTRLQLPGIMRFALVQPDGSLSYFKGS
jgi:hypothetical protein